MEQINKRLRDRRPTSYRLEKLTLEAFTRLCSQYGISKNTGLEWLIKKALKDGTLPTPTPINVEEKGFDPA